MFLIFLEYIFGLSICEVITCGDLWRWILTFPRSCPSETSFPVKEPQGR